MSEVKWIKIVVDIFDDEKILIIESMPEADAILVIWFKLLCRAGKMNNMGVFKMNGMVPYTDEMFAALFRRPLSTVRLAMRTFEQLGMIEIKDGVVMIPNWEKHQSLDALEASRAATRNRVAKFREKQRMLASCNVTGNATGGVTVTDSVTDSVTPDVTQMKRSVTQTDIDKDIDIDINKKRKKETPEVAHTGDAWTSFVIEYEQNIGLLPTSTVERGDLDMFFEEFGVDVLREIVHHTARKHPDNPHVYFAAICRKWLGKGIKTAEQAKAAIIDFDRRKNRSNRKQEQNISEEDYAAPEDFY